MPAFPLTYSSANGPVSFWAIHITTSATEGLHVTARLHHEDGSIQATLTDTTGTWRKWFDSPEEFADWANSFRGPVVRVDNQKPTPHFIRAAA